MICASLTWMRPRRVPRMYGSVAQSRSGCLMLGLELGKVCILELQGFEVPGDSYVAPFWLEPAFLLRIRIHFPKRNHIEGSRYTTAPQSFILQKPQSLDA